MVTSINLDLQGHFQAIQEEVKKSGKYFALVKEVREADRNLSSHISDILKSVDMIYQTLKINSNIMVKEYTGGRRESGKYQIIINSKGLRHKNDYYTNSDPMRVDEFKDQFNEEMMDLMYTLVKPFQQQRLAPLMALKSKFNDFKGLASTKKVLEIEPIEMAYYDGNHFTTTDIKTVTLPDVAQRDGWHGEMSDYVLIQMKSWLEPQLKAYQAEHKAKMDKLVELNKEVRAAYPLLFMFGGN